MSNKIYAIAFDCENAAGLAQFWSQLIGAPVDADPSQEFASVGLTDGAAGQPGLMFNKVPEGGRPRTASTSTWSRRHSMRR